MKTKMDGFTSRTRLAATRGTLIAMVAVCTNGAVVLSAQQATEATPATPIKTIEVGPGAVGQDSYKAGEYNGLQKKGGFPIGNMDFRGGGAYDSASALRWRVIGSDLGLETRGLSAQVGVQGKYRLRAQYDGVRRNRSDSYQTMFEGTGTNRLTLPRTWLLPNVAGSAAGDNRVNVISARGLVRTIGGASYVDAQTTSPTFGGVIAPTAAQLALVNAAADADRALFHNYNIFTRRDRVDVALDYNFDPRWLLQAQFRPEHKDGVKPLGAVSRSTGGDITTLIPDVIDTNNNQVDLSMHYKGGRSFVQVGYYGSFFKNNVPSMSWQNWAIGPTGALTNQTMSSTPSNNFSQVNVTGTFSKSPTTRLTAHGSFGRNTQNDAFVTDPTVPVMPVSSLNGLVMTTQFDTKISTKLKRRLGLSAGYRFDDRNNRTAVNIFQFSDAQQPISPLFTAGPGNPLAPVVAENAGANRSYNRRVSQVNGDADLRVSRGQWLKAGYEFSMTDRSCTNSWIDCANAATANENALRAGWRIDVMNADVIARVDYTYATRRIGDYNENAFLAIVPYANVSPSGAIGGMTYAQYLAQNGLTGWGPALPFAATTGNANIFFPGNAEVHGPVYAWENRIAELPGLRRWDQADLDRSKVRTSLAWQATETLSFDTRVDVSKDDYINSRYGMLGAKNWAVNLDSTYALDVATASLFYSYEDLDSNSAGNTFTVNSNGTNVNGATGLSGLDGCAPWTTLQQRNNNAKLDPCLDWTTDRHDKVHSAGAGLMRNIGSLGLTSDLIFTRARTHYTPRGGNYANNPRIGPGAAPTNIAAYYIKATPLPIVFTDTAEVRLNGKYSLGANKRQAVRLSYGYLRMKSDDFIYEPMQMGMGTVINHMPSMEKPFNYGVSSFGIAYIFNF